QHWTEHERDRPSFHPEFLLDSIQRVQLKHRPATQPAPSALACSKDTGVLRRSDDRDATRA
ncbi:MAG TPA: hypothetical protein VKC57_02575, partial [Ktedonobacterales bacterium]|nr:hypothetical protein [Ktedonobacterales bacterium]